MIGRVVRFFDWKFIAALAALILIVSLARSSLAAADERDRVMALWQADRKTAAAEREQASGERQRLLQGQRDLEGKYERLVVWLNGPGITVPESVLTGRPAVGDDDDSDGDDSSDDSDGGGRSPSPSSAPAAPAPRVTTPAGGGGDDPKAPSPQTGSDKPSKKPDDKPSKPDKPSPSKPTKPDKPSKNKPTK